MEGVAAGVGASTAADGDLGTGQGHGAAAGSGEGAAAASGDGAAVGSSDCADGLRPRRGWGRMPWCGCRVGFRLGPYGIVQTIIPISIGPTPQIST